MILPKILKNFLRVVYERLTGPLRTPSEAPPHFGFGFAERKACLHLALCG
jgi:hypothetical protein